MLNHGDAKELDAVEKSEHSSQELLVHYGNELAIDRDVDLFESFYSARYGVDAAKKVHARTVKGQKFLARALIILGVATFVPKCIFRSDSVFAITLIITGLMMILFGIYTYKKALKPYEATEQEIKILLEEEFSAARTKRNRIFDLLITDESIETVHGVKTGVKQRHSKKWSDITCANVTDDLIFVKGVTWFCRFQLGDERFNQIAKMLVDRCGDAVKDERCCFCQA